ncbi:MAG UNVERIFIED_CONTAM: site-specific integrase [Planctomycetaceae bacterium]|jgi:site-specific recombinase XerD
MQVAVQQFLNSLKVERNASPLTLKSYLDDLSHLQEFLQERTGRVPDPPGVDVGVLRQYVAWLHECGYARTTTARRLACLRSFSATAVARGFVTTTPQSLCGPQNRPQAATLSHDGTGRTAADHSTGKHAAGAEGQSDS